MDTNILYQIALFQSVALGEYYAATTVGKLKMYGDFGMGIFTAVNGELIMLDGTVYQALADGSVVVPNDDATVPYADVTFFHADLCKKSVSFADCSELEQQLDAIVDQEGKNRFYYVKVSGCFSKLIVRSELKQAEPYRMLNIALRSDQRAYSHNDVCGTIVGLYCPPYMAMLNAPGWHFHFISDDGTIGGHMLGAACADCCVEMAKMDRFILDIPQRDSFQALDLSTDLSAAIREAEKGGA